MRISVSPMQTERDMDGKAYVHRKSWQKTYAGIVDSAFWRKIMTLYEWLFRIETNVLILL